MFAKKKKKNQIIHFMETMTSFKPSKLMFYKFCYQKSQFIVKRDAENNVGRVFLIHKKLS